ncbi:MAG: 3-phosphoshikimate 1-carboxyvinyltransferase [Gammaproteobacteria bacterium]|nr:3-phosphoshikimate 1-carboxyvinyltransferase [Gammaproteobacteria bacterium]NIM73506.1 3-phosphoshikimate 1-carboxyvinyltransferase [Gammaproteobacteria bacterium]NIN39915.1 3-phosphoshikimate 1-carboxyvinyltransferase [Gammaproteobacteria bacterium]NIO25315.1 3-phosphoshikimate 1-carboxyvinyltransferase [Gammaproteobacteria bacterium]NIO65942.1 3-phosphoshikimate 1-carboxyvinyltransferase [Gammaproteobacteria bacterium]
MPAPVTFTIEPGGCLRGAIGVPGDKSISHRAVIFGAIAEGDTEVHGFLEAADTLATAAAFRAMGVDIDGPRDGSLRVRGVGLRGLRAPDADLDLGNSGTAMRLLPGVLAAQAFDARLRGDASLNARPMGRIITPLTSMGARIEASAGMTPPLAIRGRGAPLTAIEYRMPVASAQVKSCLLLAGLYADGVTRIHEPAPSRDHTERMLSAFGHGVQRADDAIGIEGGTELRATKVEVPGDISSAAFFLVGASIAPGSDLRIEAVGMNPTRVGVIEVLRAMGARIDVLDERSVGGEPIADVRVRAADLHGVTIPRALVPLAIDEFPALFVAAACAEGETILEGAGELRVKESDRIAAMAAGLAALGVDAEPREDGMRIRGGALGGGRVASHGDHRIAMSLAMAGLRASAPVIVDDCANVATSFPGFAALARSAGLAIDVGVGR